METKFKEHEATVLKNRMAEICEKYNLTLLARIEIKVAIDNYLLAISDEEKESDLTYREVLRG